MSGTRGRSVGIVGTGTIGASWAAWFALQGYAVRLFDEDASAVRAGVEAARGHLARMAQLGLAKPSAARAAARRLSPANSLAEAVRGAVYVQESVREEYGVKQAVFRQLDRLAPAGALLASSTSGLLMTRIQRAMRRPDRALIAHPFNPPHLVPLVELVGGARTSARALERARRFFAAHGKTPVVLHKAVPGHIANRLAAALWREAIHLVATGVASVEDVDKALYAGPGLRWAIMGQHLIYHLGGGTGGYGRFIEHIGKSFEAYWRTMPTWTRIPERAKRLVVEGVEAEAAGRSLAELAQGRDVRLAAILKALDDCRRPQSRLKGR